MTNSSGTSYRGQGSHYCKSFATRTGARCSSLEVEGLEYCLQHMPDEFLEEAEAVTGTSRCRHKFGEDGACRQIAKAGTEPPCCRAHGAAAGSWPSQQAAGRVVQNKATERMAQLLNEHAEVLANAEAVADPLAELLQLAGELLAFKEILRARISLLKPNEWRYSGKAIGEQVRAEIILYERAMERLATILQKIARLNIEQRLAAIDEQVAAHIERALDLGMEAAGGDRVKGRAAMQTYLRSIDGGRTEPTGTSGRKRHRNGTYRAAESA